MKHKHRKLAKAVIGYFVLSSAGLGVAGADDDVPLDGKWAQGGNDPNASELYTDKLGHSWVIASEGVGGNWFALPGDASTFKTYGIPSDGKHRVVGSDKHAAALGVDTAVYRWRLTEGDLKKPSGFPWLLVLVGVLAYKRRRR